MKLSKYLNNKEKMYLESLGLYAAGVLAYGALWLITNQMEKRKQAKDAAQIKKMKENLEVILKDDNKFEDFIFDVKQKKQSKEINDQVQKLRNFKKQYKNGSIKLNTILDQFQELLA